MTDVDPNLILRTAAKGHRCDGNGTGASVREHAPDCDPEATTPMIQPGERYVEYVGETPAWQSGSHHSMACALMHFDVVEVDGELADVETVEGR